MPMNDAAASGHVCPGIRIHIIDIVQPPGIGIPPIADMDTHQTIVSAALMAKSDAEMPANARWEVRSEAMPASMLRQIRDSKLPAREVVLVMDAVSVSSSACRPLGTRSRYWQARFSACRFAGRPNTRLSGETIGRWDVHRYGN